MTSGVQSLPWHRPPGQVCEASLWDQTLRSVYFRGYPIRHVTLRFAVAHSHRHGVLRENDIMFRMLDIARLWLYDNPSNHEVLSPSTCIITKTLEEGAMKIFLNIVGILLILAGGTFFLQGINILPGSFMTGDPQWAINGSIMIVIAIGLMIWAWRRK